MRPAYETPSDLAIEAGVLDKYVAYLTAKGKPCSWKKLTPPRYSIDAAIAQNTTILAWAEVKARVGDPDRYDTWYVSLHKLRSGISLSHDTGLPFILLFDWSGRTFKTTVKTLDWCEIAWSGRADRNYPDDMEPVVHIPKGWFTEILTP